MITVTMTQREAWAIEYAEQYINNWELYIVAKSSFLAGFTEATRYPDSGEHGEKLVSVSLDTHQIGAKSVNSIQEG